VFGVFGAGLGDADGQELKQNFLHWRSKFKRYMDNRLAHCNAYHFMQNPFSGIDKLNLS
jgi:hypothetical protein